MTTLQAVLAALGEIAPLHRAAPWDNVGLLVEPIGRDAPVRRVLLTIDLTEAVFAEAVAARADLVVAYHPLIFSGWKRLDRGDALRRVAIDAIRAGIAVYSPHTAADAAPGGVCDWLLDAVGETVGRGAIEAVEASDDSGSKGAAIGMGRVGELVAPAALGALVERIKGALGLPGVRVAAAGRHALGEGIRRVAVCPGAGGSLFASLPASGPRAPELLLTGEMRHHDVLARVAAGTSVVLTDHTNCERGWLPVLRQALLDRLGGGVTIALATADEDPLRIV